MDDIIRGVASTILHPRDHRSLLDALAECLQIADGDTSNSKAKCRCSCLQFTADPVAKTRFVEHEFALRKSAIDHKSSPDEFGRIMSTVRASETNLSVGFPDENVAIELLDRLERIERAISELLRQKTIKEWYTTEEVAAIVRNQGLTLGELP